MVNSEEALLHSSAETLRSKVSMLKGLHKTIKSYLQTCPASRSASFMTISLSCCSSSSTLAASSVVRAITGVGGGP